MSIRTSRQFYLFIMAGCVIVAATAMSAHATESTTQPMTEALKAQSIDTIVESLKDKWYSLLDHLPQLGVGLVVIFLTWAIARLVGSLLRRILPRIHTRRSLQDLLQKLAFILIWVAGVMTVVTIIFPSVTPGKLLAALGLGSIAIGFAFKDIIENFFAGVLILFREPFKLGDYIECEGIEGDVEDIAIRESYIRQLDGQLVVLPNARLFKNPVTVRTDQELRRVTVICGVAYGEDVDESRSIIHDAVKQLESVDTSKPVQVFAQEFASSSINFEVTWWTGSRQVDIRKSRDKVVAAVKRALDDNGIEIPFPYRTLTFSEPLQVSQRNDESRPSGDA